MDSRRNFLRGLARAAARVQPDEPGDRDSERAARRLPSGEPQPSSPRPVEPGGASAGEPGPRHADALLDPGWGAPAQAAVAGSDVLVLGASGLASPVAAYLVGAGVGRLGILDDEPVVVAELHAQHLHFTPDVGVPRVHSAAAKLGFLNPEVIVEPYQVALGAENAGALLAGHDLVVDCFGDPALAQLVNQTCCEEGVALVSAVVHRHGATVHHVDPGRTACLHCAGVFVDPATAREHSALAGPVLGMVGSVQAAVALRALAGSATAGPPAALAIDLDPPRLEPLDLERRADCPVCGGR